MKIALLVFLLVLTSTPQAVYASAALFSQAQTSPPLPAGLSDLSDWVADELSESTIPVTDKQFKKAGLMGEYHSGGFWFPDYIYIDTQEIKKIFKITEPEALSAMQAAAIYHEYLHEQFGTSGSADPNAPANQENCEHMAITIAAIPNFLCELITLYITFPPEIISCDVLDELCVALQQGIDHVNSGPLWAACQALTTTTPPGYVTPTGPPDLPDPSDPLVICDGC